MLKKVAPLETLWYDVGATWYYMGDFEPGEGPAEEFTTIKLCSSNGIDISNVRFLTENELFNKYKIKIISWDYTPPIQNSFS